MTVCLSNLEICFLQAPARKKFVRFLQPAGNKTVDEAISGVPQDSVIGLILFVIYVNDLHDHLSAHSLLYADDVKLIAPETAMIFSKTP